MLTRRNGRERQRGVTVRDAGSNVSVSVIVVIRDAFVIANGMRYGPPPTRMGVLGGVTITWADPTPGEVTVGAGSGGGPAAAGGGCAGGCA